MFFSDLRHTRLAYAVFATEAGQGLVERASWDIDNVKSFFMQMLDGHFGPNPSNSIMQLQAVWVGKTRLGPELTASLMATIRNLPRQYQMDAGLVQEPVSIYWLLLSLQQLVWRAHKDLELQVELENGDLAVFLAVSELEDWAAGALTEPRIITKRDRLALAIQERFGFDPRNPPTVAETWGNFWTPKQQDLYKDKE